LDELRQILEVMKMGAWLTASVGGVELNNFVLLTRYRLEHLEDFQHIIVPWLPDRWPGQIAGSC
jgi:hypothetical protein